MGSPIGTKEFCESFVSGLVLVAELKQELVDLSKIATKDPQVCYSAYVFGLSKRWLYIMRTTPGISHLFEPLENCITENFLTSIFKQFDYDTNFRDVVALPAKLGGLSIFDPTQVADHEQ